MFKLLIFGLFLGVVLSADPAAWKDKSVTSLPGDIEPVFENWKAEFKKVYQFEAREKQALETFTKNWEMVISHNKEFSARNVTWSLKLNQFADLTEEQFAEEMLCLGGRQRRAPSMGPDSFARVEAPDAVDWTDVDGKSYVSVVKNQGSCGSCWTFSATGATESLWAIDQGWTGDDIILLSEQQLVDCTYAFHKGCNGGLMEDAFDYIHQEGGLCTEDEYPYTAKDGDCMASTCGTKYDTVSGYRSVDQTETALKNAIAIGPVSVSVDAGTGWQFYSSGVYSGSCGTSLNHGVLGVGYGSDSGDDFWKIKNSWGSSWGEDGYIRLCRNCGHSSGECGCLLDNDYPIM